jgi:hypothetical protein
VVFVVLFSTNAPQRSKDYEQKQEIWLLGSSVVIVSVVRALELG